MYTYDRFYILKVKLVYVKEKLSLPYFNSVSNSSPIAFFHQRSQLEELLISISFKSPGWY